MQVSTLENKTIGKRLQFDSVFKDARHAQILFLGSFLWFGIYALGWEADLQRYGVTILSCLSFQLFATAFTTKNWTSWKSGLISALGLCLLLKTNSLWTVVGASALTVCSKFLIHIKYKHIFNPVNFGIVVTVMLTGDAWVSPGQWGNELVLVGFMTVAALFVLFKVGRIDTSLVFLVTFFVLEWGRSVAYKGWPLDFLTHKFTSGTLLLFTFFMITDPMTTPNHPRGRIIWSVMVALMAFVLSDFMHVYTAPIWALFVLSPFTPLFDKIFINNKFKWK